MSPRRFDHFAIELSVAAGELAPRYALWLRLQELGWDPLDLQREHVATFLDEHLVRFMKDEQLSIAPRPLRQLRKRVLRFEPDQPTPDEILERIFGTARTADR